MYWVNYDNYGAVLQVSVGLEVLAVCARQNVGFAVFSGRVNATPTSFTVEAGVL